MSILIDAKAFEKVRGNLESVLESDSSVTDAGGRDGPGGSGGDEEARSLVRAALPRALDVLRKADRGDGVLLAPDDRLASLLQYAATEYAQQQLQAGAPGVRLQPLEAGGYEVTFDEGDIAGWIGDYLPSWIKGRFAKRPWKAPSESVTTIPDDARVAVLGDWGSGMYGAPACARTILEQRAKPYDVVMHLGDVYYAGTSSEVRDRFLAVWPRVPKAHHRALNSNHEMYSGGEGYFDGTLKDPAFREQEGSSCFAMQNSHFLLLGLDTAYEDARLAQPQIEWVARRVANANGRKVVLFSHHQLFSAFESQGGALQQNLRPFLDEKKIFAWYWGHEHRCVVFDRHDGWNMWARCIGHGGYPAYRDKYGYAPARQNADDSAWFAVKRESAPACEALDGPNPYISGQEAKYAPNGYASLDFDGDQLHETILSPDGAVLMTGTLE